MKFENYKFFVVGANYQKGLNFYDKDILLF